jgi:hypothetical protein
MSFEYLALQLVKNGVRNPVQSGDRLYFKYDEKAFCIEPVDNYWDLVCYTYQHNAPSVENSRVRVEKGNWKYMLELLDSAA